MTRIDPKPRFVCDVCGKEEECDDYPPKPIPPWGWHSANLVVKEDGVTTIGKHFDLCEYCSKRYVELALELTEKLMEGTK